MYDAIDFTSSTSASDHGPSLADLAVTGDSVCSSPAQTVKSNAMRADMDVILGWAGSDSDRDRRGITQDGNAPTLSLASSLPATTPPLVPSKSIASVERDTTLSPAESNSTRSSADQGADPMALVDEHPSGGVELPSRSLSLLDGMAPDFLSFQGV